MTGDPGAFPPEALEDVAYLGRSANRPRLLRALASEPATRSKLEDRTGVATTTVGRILVELQERGWAERTADGRYVATPSGRVALRAFAPTVTAMETIRSLGDAAGWLPLAELSIGVHHFADARVVRPAPNAPLELVDYLADRIGGASTFRALTFLDPPTPAGEAMHAGVVEGDLDAEHVLAGGLAEHLRDRRKSPPRWREYLEAGARVYRYEGHVPCNLFVLDGTALIMSDRPEGGGAVVESTDDTVLAAVDDLYAAYRDDAERIEVGFFASRG